ncbi:hypothetical protein QYH69_10050 [Paraburkholderia sp. SARCC-3016]|uniref:hypothetical protein n=1 Tax=Paraburkholderia sp. SARCC-3016 TaxID=3058611 RepID=UPI0028090375|nr:hypothetical protein [Paraburkholderia sp. SARCC-3016]MDQ7977579.1 hypothetical protein [Paraburkholderia sp. SARCC-3016]
MIISPPFLPPAGVVCADEYETDPMMAAVEQCELGHHGIYPIAFDRRWHCGMHLAPNDQTEPVRAIADGEVIAFRVAGTAISDGQPDEKTGKPALNSNTGFVLLKHVTDTGGGRTITFYSLYMHLRDMAEQERLERQPNDPPQQGSATALPAWLLDNAGGKDGKVQSGGGRKIYRKDRLGYWGACHGQPHLHFEIFMTEADFGAWFEQDGHKVQLGLANPVQPASRDYWGHSYFVIPGGQALVSAPPGRRDSPYFPTLAAWTVPANSKLYVEAYFHKGQRYTRSWFDEAGDGNKLTLLTEQPVKDRYADYEYKLYQRAVDLYPACPSDGYELMRFGRILSEQPTLPAADRATWVAVPFDANGTQGYVDVNQSAILKLSDADFPFFTGWKKIEDGNTPFDQDGLCGYAELRRIVGDVEAQIATSPEEGPHALRGDQGKVGEGHGTQAVGLPLGKQQYGHGGFSDASNVADSEFRHEDRLTAYVQGDAAIRNRLKGFVCHAPSEWDATTDEERFKRLNEPDGFFGKRKESDPNGYENFIAFRQRFQFIEQTPLGGGQKFWFFHPLAFIRHFRKCGWLSGKELTQLVPTKAMRKNGHGKWVSEKIDLMKGAQDIIKKIDLDLNKTLRKFSITPCPLRTAAFFGNATQETQWFSKLYENNSAAWYSPWDGRGLLQLTGPGNYIKYWRFLGRSIPDSCEAALNAAARKAHDDRKNEALLDARLRELTSEVIQWRKDIEVSAIDATESAGAYWAWTKASIYADRFPALKREIQIINNASHIYYSNEHFGQVAATVNFGSPVINHASIAKVNGIVARYQAYVNALVVLADYMPFSGATGVVEITPDGYERRNIQ